MNCPTFDVDSSALSIDKEAGSSIISTRDLGQPTTLMFAFVV